MFDHNKLVGRIKEICKTQTEFGKQMGWSHTTTVLKINGNRAFTQDEIHRAVKILKLDSSEIPLYFFTLKV